MGTVCSASENISVEGTSSGVVSSVRQSKSSKSDQVTLVSVKGKEPDILFGTSSITTYSHSGVDQTSSDANAKAGERKTSVNSLKYEVKPKVTVTEHQQDTSIEKPAAVNSGSISDEHKYIKESALPKVRPLASGNVKQEGDTNDVINAAVGEDTLEVEVAQRENPVCQDATQPDNPVYLATLNADDRVTATATVTVTDRATIDQDTFSSIPTPNDNVQVEVSDTNVVESGVTTTSSSSPLDERETEMASFGSLAIGKPAPAFECQAVVNGDFKPVKLSDYRGKYVVLFFYPLDFTFVCPTEIIAFSDRSEEFRAIGCEVLACSTDSIYSHLAWVDTPRKQGGLGPMKIPLLADKTHEVSKKYGCLKEDEGIAFRALYIIDDKGNLRQITINDLPVGRSVDETLRLVQAFQFTDKHGEVCPAGWKPGKETMKPDPKESQKYFKSVN